MRPLLAFTIVASFSLACQGDPEEGAETSASLASDTASSPAEPAGHDHDPDIPGRSAEIERDQGSRPQEVMDFVGIQRGDAVADIFAGGGYFTYLLSERVGPEGEVYAQGYNPNLQARVARGDLAGAANVTLVDSLDQLPADALDATLIVRGYHLFEDPARLFDALHRALKPGGTIGIVEVRLGQPEGHDMETHRMGEQTVIDQFSDAGFEYIGESDVLRNPEDDHTGFWEDRRHLTDRMLLKFAEPGEPISDQPATAQRGR